MAANRDELRRALAVALASHRAASSADGVRQHEGSGHVEAWRVVVSRPRNHFESR